MAAKWLQPHIPVPRGVSSLIRAFAGTCELSDVCAGYAIRARLNLEKFSLLVVVLFDHFARRATPRRWQGSKWIGVLAP
jgi:hypothetical protein